MEEGGGGGGGTFLSNVRTFTYIYISGSQALTVDQAPYNTSAVIGGNATLTCSVSNKQSSENVKWYAVCGYSFVSV